MRRQPKHSLDVAGEPWAWPFEGLQRRHYRVLLIDPPWHFSTGTKGRPQHYPRMRDDEIAAMRIQELAHPDGCWIFVWTTSPKTQALFQKISPAWKVTFSGKAFEWAKLHKRFGRSGTPLFFHRDSFHTGQGFTTRKNAEACWLFKLGRPKRMGKNIHELIISPLREHSRKPDETFDRIEAFAAGPYAELFSREQRPGWDSWGNQSTLFNREAA